MTLNELLRNLIEAFGYTPYAELELRWHERLARWSADISYWSCLQKPCWGKTPEEAVRTLCSQLKGVECYRTRANGSWGRYIVPEEVTCDDVAFTSPKPRPAIVEGRNELLCSEAREFLEKAEVVYLRTYLGDRTIKGPVENMVKEDKDGSAYRRTLEHMQLCPDEPVEIGYYKDGKEIGLRGGLY
jgi:hypothetical protein